MERLITKLFVDPQSDAHQDYKDYFLDLVEPKSDADEEYFLDLKTSRKCSLEVEPRKAWRPKVGLEDSKPVSGQ